MGSLGDETKEKMKAMWLYPKVLGNNPSQRWGHSACLSHGVIYIYGGCCGGVHFSDVLTLNIHTMTCTTFATTGRGPGPRDSHTAVLVSNKMIIFGGTNGSHKVNDLHILDLVTREWSKPNFLGTPPSRRESHTATVVGEDKMVIFGGSGEGVGNYLNDLHVLDLRTMRWSSLDGARVRGVWPFPRDSHSAVAVENTIIIYGGDSGDRYHGDIAVFDMEKFTWSRLLVDGCSPDARAGHASVTIGSKVYVIGGVGDKHYYNDVWAIDISTSCSWTHLDVGGQRPQGRFSHAAISTTGSDITIYGGCGEDERPLSELLVLKLEKDGQNGPCNISTCKIFNNNHWGRDQGRYLRRGGEDITDLQSLRFHSDIVHPKRRRMSNLKVLDKKPEQECRSVSLASKSPMPLLSDDNQSRIQKHPETSTGVPSFHLFKHFRRNHKYQTFNHQKQELSAAVAGAAAKQHIPLLCKASDSTISQNLIGANVIGKVDGTFDSGLLLTAVVNGNVFRGILFSPGHEVRPQLQFTSPAVVTKSAAKPSNLSVAQSSEEERPQPPAKLRNDLHGIVLTLGPGVVNKNEK